MTITATNSNGYVELCNMINALGPAAIIRRFIPPGYYGNCPHCGSPELDLFSDNAWYSCQSCSNWGDVVDFIMAAFEINNRDSALEYLSHRCESDRYRSVI